MGAILRIFPLIFLVIIIYNIVLFVQIGFGGGHFMAASDMRAMLDATPLPPLNMISGSWRITWGTIFVVGGLFALFIELVRATRTDSISITNHALSVIVLIIGVVEFVAVKGCNTSEFFYLTIMAMIDVIAGVTETITNARRDFGGSGIAV